MLSDKQLKSVLGGCGGNGSGSGNYKTCFIDGECVCGGLCTSDSQCEGWHGKGSKCSCVAC